MLIIAGVYLIQERQLTMGGLIAVTMLGGRAIAPLGQAVGMLMQFQNARMSLETLDKLMAQEVERPDAADKLPPLGAGGSGVGAGATAARNAATDAKVFVMLCALSAEFGTPQAIPPQ